MYWDISVACASLISEKGCTMHIKFRRLNMLKDKIQLTLIIVITILVMTQIYTLVELVRLNSIEDGKSCKEGQRFMSKTPT